MSDFGLAFVASSSVSLAIFSPNGLKSRRAMTLP